jgi:hypothetical protein
VTSFKSCASGSALLSGHVGGPPKKPVGFCHIYTLCVVHPAPPAAQDFFSQMCHFSAKFHTPNDEEKAMAVIFGHRLSG